MDEKAVIALCIALGTAALGFVMYNYSVVLL